MAFYRIPACLKEVTVNGCFYRALGTGIFQPLNDQDAEEMRKLGGILDGGTGAAPEWVQALDGTVEGMLRPDGTTRRSDGWEDLTFAAQGINPPGGAGSATRDASTGLISFAGNADNMIAGMAQMRHSWRQGSVIASFGDLDMTGYLISAGLAWRITRLAGTDSADNDTAAAILTDFDIHYQRDGDGSLQETAK
jgi:hypothetical protein